MHRINQAIKYFEDAYKLLNIIFLKAHQKNTTYHGEPSRHIL